MVLKRQFFAQGHVSKLRLQLPPRSLYLWGATSARKRRRQLPCGPIARYLLLDGEWLKELSQIDHNIANFCGFGNSSRCRNFTKVLIDSGQLFIVRRDK